jgi:hypothetical protein
VKLVPRGSQVIGRVVVKRVLSAIVRPDETRETTKFVLVDAVGPDAAAKGVKVGDVILPTAMSNIKLDGGVSVRPIVPEAGIAAFLTGVDVAQLAVQTDGATEYVAFGDPRAAQSIAENSAEAHASSRLFADNSQPNSPRAA